MLQLTSTFYFKMKRKPMCPGRSVLKSSLTVAPYWWFFPRKASQVQQLPFKTLTNISMAPDLQWWKVTSSVHTIWVSFPQTKGLTEHSAWRQWSMKRLMAFLENKVCLNHLSRKTPSSFMEKSVFQGLSYLCYEKKCLSFTLQYNDLFLPVPDIPSLRGHVS